MPRAMIVLRRLLRSQQAGLVLIIATLMIALAIAAGSHVDESTGETVNNFLNSYTLIQTATDASFIAIMAVGATVVIISGGIDLSVGSVYALAGVVMGLALRGSAGGAGAVWLGLLICVAIGLAAGAVNGAMVVGLRVHPFIITLGSMWILRGIAFVTSKAESIMLPESLAHFRQGAARPGNGALPGPDAGDAGGRARWARSTWNGRSWDATSSPWEGTPRPAATRGCAWGESRSASMSWPGDRRPGGLPGGQLLRLGLLWRRDRI